MKLSDEADLQDRAQAGLEAVVDDSIQKTGQVAESGRVADPVETSHGTRNEVEGDSPKGASFVSGGGRSAVWRLSLLGGAGILICGVSGFLLIRQCYHKEEPVI